MPEITALTPTRRDPARLTIKVDRRVVATLPDTQVHELGLTVGTAWTDALAEQVEAANGYDKALRYAMNSLGRRSVSRRKLDRKLADREVAETVRQRVLDRLETLGLVDDAVLGAALIREAVRAKPAGPALLRQKLFKAGIDRDVSDRLLAEHEQAQDPQDTRDQALDLATRRYQTLSRYDEPTRRRRVYGLLARRGFSPDLIRDVMDRLPTDDSAP